MNNDDIQVTTTSILVTKAVTTETTMHDNIVEYMKLLLNVPSLTEFATVNGNVDNAGEDNGVVIMMCNYS